MDTRFGSTSGGSDEASARRALVDQVRTLAGAALLTNEGTDALDRARQLVTEANSLLHGNMRSSRYEGAAGLSPGISAANDPIWETHAAFGTSNALAPPVIVTERPGRVEGSVTFTAPYEGGPGAVYGGFVAAAFDGVLGRAVISSGRLAVTRSLTIRYLRAVPLFDVLQIEAEVGRVEGRQVEVSGRLCAGNQVACEAEAVFTCVDGRRYRIAPPDDRGGSGQTR